MLTCHVDDGVTRADVEQGIAQRAEKKTSAIFYVMRCLELDQGKPASYIRLQRSLEDGMRVGHMAQLIEQLETDPERCAKETPCKTLVPAKENARFDAWQRKRYSWRAMRHMSWSASELLHAAGGAEQSKLRKRKKKTYSPNYM